MPTFETLDAIADAFNPVLLLLTLMLPMSQSVRNSIPVRCWYALIAASLVIVYGLAAVDDRLGVWNGLGSDFSTHSAFAIALALTTRYAGLRIFMAVGATVVAYLMLVLYQRYHSALDVMSTCAVAGGIAFLTQRLIRSRWLRKS